MSETPDMQELARRFLDLWQEQLSLMSGAQEQSAEAPDPFAAWQSLMQGGMPGIMGGGVPGIFPGHLASLFPGAQPPGGERNTDEPASSAKAGAGTAAGATTAGAASGNDLDALRQLASRVELLDERLARIEAQLVPSGASGAGGKPAGKLARGGRKSGGRKPAG